MPTSRHGDPGKHRTARRPAGLRPVEIGEPDTHQPEFAAECRRQSDVAAKADAAECNLDALLERALTDLSDDTDR